MGLENVKCFNCGDYGHLERDCPQKQYAAELGDGKPPWCGQCDRETRLVYFIRDAIETARRCYTCSPGSQTLPSQYRRCKGCRVVIYEWDQRSACGTHLAVGQQLKVAEGFRPPTAEEKAAAAAAEKKKWQDQQASLTV